MVLNTAYPPFVYYTYIIPQNGVNCNIGAPFCRNFYGKILYLRQRRRDMKEKIKRFCDEYLVDLNAAAAARRAGYSERSARQKGHLLLTRDDARAYIEARMAEKESELIAKQDEVLKTLTRILRREENEHVVETVRTVRVGIDEDGRKYTDTSDEPKVVEMPAKIADINKAAELLGKHYQLFTDRVKMDGVKTVIFEGEDELCP